MPPPVDAAIHGSLLATALGDALGLPFEGLSKRRIARLNPSARFRLLFGRGMVSDDADHAALVVLALGASAGDPDLFERSLRHGLARWFLTLPAGIGLATARSCIRMCLGIRRSGVGSAGNGPAMRAAVVGAAVDDLGRLLELVARSTRLTHTDPRALQGSIAVALAARHFRRHPSPDRGELRRELRDLIANLDPAFAAELNAALDAHAIDTPTFAASRGHAHRVGGFIVHTVPVALHAALAHADEPVTAALACIRCGGDTDTTAAIAAGIVGARTGPSSIDEGLCRRIVDWPRGLERMQRWSNAAAAALATGARRPQRQPPFVLQLARNLCFLGVVLAHALRRLFPPY